jgi:uncharacterized protein with NAD-binding domain and iron-sulfur cluster
MVQVAILGGGPAALVAAYQLTTQEPGRYQITIYEMSWRLGGKTASGRGPHGRIEEHGLHILFGGYHNTFDLMTACYQAARAECGPHAVPFPRFLDAVQPGNYGVIGDDRTRPWRRWPLQFPTNRGVPGDAPLPRTWDLASGLLQLLLHVVFGAHVVRAWQRLLARPGPLRDPRPQPHSIDRPDGGDACLHHLIIPAFRAAMNADRWIGRVVERVTRLVQWTLHRSERLLVWLSPSGFPPRIWTALDLVLATFLGLCRDRVLVRPDGYERLDDVDLRAWLRRHGSREETLDSPLARVVYEATFQGFFTEQVAAGAALRILLWMAFTYKGSMYYRMKGATGDIIDMPLYLLLKQRGVKFAFFHRVKALRTGHDAEGQPVIDAIELERLARPLGDDYDPTVVIDNDICWPAQPRLDRLHPDDHHDAVPAEDPYHRGRTTPVRVQRRVDGRPTEGATFDQIIFGIPVACIPLVCADLVKEGRSRWARQSEIVATPTVALQLWCKASLAELGWREPAPLLSLFWDPMNTWCDMSQTLAREPWTTTGRPSTVAYFCGPLFLDNLGASAPDLARLEPAYDRAFRAHCDAQARRARTDLLHRLHELWPAIGGGETPRGPAPLHHNVLFDPDNGKDEARLEAQYLRSNHDPHARCTLALPGQTALRMRADDTGYANLIVAGDWTANEILVPCLEGAVQSGIRAARALSNEKHRYRIVGEALLTPGRPLDAPAVPSDREAPNDDHGDPPPRRKRAPQGEPPQLEL